MDGKHDVERVETWKITLFASSDTQLKVLKRFQENLNQMKWKTESKNQFD